MSGQLRLRGSIPALVTPMRDGAIDEAALKRLVDWHIDQGSHGLVPVGTTGESPTLSHEEHDFVVEVVIKAAAGRVPVIAGACSNSTAEAIRLTRHAEAAGADAALVIAPYYNKPTQAGMLANFQAIHDDSGLPLVLYNVPGRTACDISLETLAQLSELPRVVAVKDATADLARPALQALMSSEGFIQLSGEDATAVPFNAVGGVGCISVTANVAPRLCAEMQEATLAGEFIKAREINARLAPLHRALFLETSPGPVKYACEALGLCAGDIRLPLVPPSDDTKAAVRAALIHAGLLNG